MKKIIICFLLCFLISNIAHAVSDTEKDQISEKTDWIAASGKDHTMFDLEKDWLGKKPDWAPDFSYSVAFLSKYIWRGWNLGDRPVMQMDGNVSKWGLTFDLWTNYTLCTNKEKDSGRYLEFTEVDYSIDYLVNVGEATEFFNIDSPEFIDPVSVMVGYYYYTFPNLNWRDKFFDDHEMCLGVFYDIFLQPFFKWYWDLDVGKGNSDGGGNGSYYLFGISHTVEFKKTGISVTGSMTTGIIDQQWTTKRGWGDMNFTGEVNIPVLNYFTVTPMITGTVILDKGVYNYAASNEVYGGVTMGFAY